MTANWKETLAQNLARLRRENGLTQAELGEKLNYSDKSISKWERAEGIPDLQVMVQLSEMYSVSIDEMIGKTDEKNMPVKKDGYTHLADRTFLMIITQSIIWLIAIVMFTSLLLFAQETPKKWLMFIYAVPASSLAAGIYFIIWKLKMWAYGAFCVFMWMAAVAAQLTIGARFAPMIYTIGAILQLISIIVIGIIALTRKKKQ